MQGADRDMVKVWQKHNQHRFDNIMTKTKTVGVEALPEGLRSHLKRQEAGAKHQNHWFDLVWWRWVAARTVRKLLPTKLAWQ